MIETLYGNMFDLSWTIKMHQPDKSRDFKHLLTGETQSWGSLIINLLQEFNVVPWLWCWITKACSEMTLHSVNFMIDSWRSTRWLGGWCPAPETGSPPYTKWRSLPRTSVQPSPGSGTSCHNWRRWRRPRAKFSSVKR